MNKYTFSVNRSEIKAIEVTVVAASFDDAYVKAVNKAADTDFSGVSTQSVEYDADLIGEVTLPKLSVSVKPVYTVEVYALENVVEELYGPGFEAAAQDEWADEDAYEYSVAKADTIPASIEENIRKGKYTREVRVWHVLTLLARDGVIEEGEYLIKK